MTNEDKTLVIIPTRDRPEYLTLLLSSLLLQDDPSFDILILDSGEPEAEFRSVPKKYEAYTHVVSALRGSGHLVQHMPVKVLGRSEVSAVNYGMSLALAREYGFVFKVDDDHIVPGDALRSLRNKLLKYSAQNSGPVLISGVTPWAVKKEGLENAYGPETTFDDDPQGEILTIDEASDDPAIDPVHFMRYPNVTKEVYDTELASAANFFMRPDTRILWAEINGSSLLADARWFLQLKKYLHYRLYFDLQLNVWHMVAKSGGVHREGETPQQSSKDLERTGFFLSFLHSL